MAQQRVQLTKGKGKGKGKGDKGGKGGGGKGKRKANKGVPPQLTTVEDAGVARQQMGMKLYPMVASLAGEVVASKVTGMLLEMEPQALIALMQNSAELQGKVNQAVAILQKVQSSGFGRRSTV